MIGIDLTNISRFATMRASMRARIAQRFHHDYTDPRQLAKWWACAEAVHKCRGSSPDWSQTQILFPQGSAPQYKGNESIQLSLSHEGDLVTAVALLCPAVKTA